MVQDTEESVSLCSDLVPKVPVLGGCILCDSFHIMPTRHIMRESSGLFQALLSGLTGRSVTWTFLDRSGTPLVTHFICHACSLVTWRKPLWYFGVFPPAWRQGCCSGETAF